MRLFRARIAKVCGSAKRLFRVYIRFGSCLTGPQVQADVRNDELGAAQEQGFWCHDKAALAVMLLSTAFSLTAPVSRSERITFTTRIAGANPSSTGLYAAAGGSIILSIPELRIAAQPARAIVTRIWRHNAPVRTLRL